MSNYSSTLIETDSLMSAKSIKNDPEAHFLSISQLFKEIKQKDKLI